MTRYLIILIFIFLTVSCSQRPAEVVVHSSVSPEVNDKKKDSKNPYQISVKYGDTLYSIARKYKVGIRELIELNKLRPPFFLSAGEVLKLPKATFHVVKEGDTLYDISRGYGLDMSSLVRVNNLEYPYNIKRGSKIRLPYSAYKTSKSVLQAAPVGRVDVEDLDRVNDDNDDGLELASDVDEVGKEVIKLPEQIEQKDKVQIAAIDKKNIVEDIKLEKVNTEKSKEVILKFEDDQGTKSSSSIISPSANKVQPINNGGSAPVPSLKVAALSDSIIPIPVLSGKDSAYAATGNVVAPVLKNTTNVVGAPKNLIPVPKNKTIKNSAPSTRKIQKTKTASLTPVRSASEIKKKKYSEKVTSRPKSGKVNFSWPVNGKLISKFGPKKGGLYNDGINIEASEGSPIKAADSGVVVYSGNELRGYGNLLLIKHDNGFLTAYAHKKRSVVKKGDKVAKGQVIGFVGSSGNVSKPQLHFSIRKGRKAVDPEKYL